MDLFIDFILKNFFLLCLTLGVIFMVLKGYRTNKNIVLFPILVVSGALILSILYFLEVYTAQFTNLVFFTTLCFSLAFIIRPIILYFFMKLTIDNKIILLIAKILIGINAVIYIFPLFISVPALSNLVLHYEEGVAVRGPGFFTCHIIMGVMMTYFVIHSVLALKGRHRSDIFACLICVLFIGIAVVIETLLVADYVLNTTIAISCLFYVVYLYQQSSARDALTQLYDRKAYYNDLSKIENRVTGIAAIDMNSLKQINDNQGHRAGDLALKTIAKAINGSIDHNSMDAYRMGGDEFVVLSTSSKENALAEVIDTIKEKLKSTPYTVAVGYATRKGEEISTHNLLIYADEMMYKDKEEYYLKNNIERRKTKESLVNNEE